MSQSIFFFFLKHLLAFYDQDIKSPVIKETNVRRWNVKERNLRRGISEKTIETRLLSRLFLRVYRGNNGELNDIVSILSVARNEV